MTDPAQPEQQLPSPRRASRWRRFRWGLYLLAGALVVGGALFGLWAHQRWTLCNFHVVVGGQVYRSAQPGPERLRKWVREYGLRTVVNLRSDTFRPVVAEEGALVKQLGLRYESVRLTKHRLPTRAVLRRLIQTIETGETPMLLHCKAGADRAGIASVVAAMAIGEESYASARKHLSVRYLHFDPFPDHVGGCLRRYEDYCRRQGLGTGGWQQFRHWALHVYDPDPPG